MHQYKIEITLYSPEGALTKKQVIKYADSPEQAERTMADYKDVYQTDEAGKPTFKAYRVRLFVASYKMIAEPETFFEIFKVI